MAVTVIATVGSATANSYLAVADADTYLDGCADSHTAAVAWRALTGGTAADTKARAVIDATRRLDTLAYLGDCTTPDTQRLQWPRKYVPDPRRGAGRDPQTWPNVPLSADLTAYLASDTIPALLTAACAELAAELVAAGTSDPFAADTQGNVKRKETGPLVTEYFEPGRATRGLARYPRVCALLAHLLASDARLVRG